MLPAKRRAEIVRLLQMDGPTAVLDLASRMNASPATIRRDLAYLSTQGILTRIHGGATISGDSTERVPFSTVASTDAADKEAVARRAAQLVPDRAVVLLDIGTTTMRLARHLRGRPITVITSSLAVLDALRDDSAVELVLVGGVVRSEYHSLVGVLTDGALAQVRADIAFLGASGVRPDGWVLDTTRVEVPVKKAIMRAADRSILLVDKHKFPGTGALRVCGAGDLDVLVTNTGADAATMDTCAAAGVEVLTA